jgi:dihydropteroate synthase
MTGRSDSAASSSPTPIGRRVVGAHRSFDVGGRTRVMGVVNVTPDSFSDGGRYLDPATAIAHAERLVAEGADLVDLGGESTRPGATPVPPEAEWRRVAPVLAGLAGRIEVPLSIDTRHPEVAERAIAAGADVVNDVEGLRSEAMRRVVARSGAAAIIMHMRGDPATMQDDLVYSDLVGEIVGWIADRVIEARTAGIGRDRLIVDPGLGFGKSPAQSLELLVRAGEFHRIGYPVLIAASRKSFLGHLTGTTDPTARLEAGLAAAVLAAEQGVEIVRTHDVGPTVRALSVVAAARALRGVPAR